MGQPLMLRHPRLLLLAVAVALTPPRAHAGFCDLPENYCSCNEPDDPSCVTESAEHKCPASAACTGPPAAAEVQQVNEFCNHDKSKCKVRNQPDSQCFDTPASTSCSDGYVKYQRDQNCGIQSPDSERCAFYCTPPGAFSRGR